jgi:hypothetical protein
VVLVHCPVVNKHGATIASAVTNLDLHDIARASKTYGVRRFYVVTPLNDQKKLVERIVNHWTGGRGAQYNPQRREALELIRVHTSLESVVAAVGRQGAEPPFRMATCARPLAGRISCRAARGLLATGRHGLLILGTAWGLAPEVLDAADAVLEPIWGPSGYNHLSVRSAAAILLDRLMSPG